MSFLIKILNIYFRNIKKDVIMYDNHAGMKLKVMKRSQLFILIRLLQIIYNF